MIFMIDLNSYVRKVQKLDIEIELKVISYFEIDPVMIVMN